MDSSHFRADLHDRMHAAEPEARRPRSLDHDLRNLVSLIRSVAHLMRAGTNGPLTQAQDEYLGELLEGAHRVMRHLEPAGDPALRPKGDAS